jgi:hypothetical protein
VKRRRPVGFRRVHGGFSSWRRQHGADGVAVSRLHGVGQRQSRSAGQRPKAQNNPERQRPYF